MNVAQQVLEEKIVELSNQLRSYQAATMFLVFKVGKGKNVSVSKGERRQAEGTIESVDFREMSSGEVRFTVKQRKEEKK